MKQLLMALSAYPWPRSALLRILFDRLRQKVGQIVSLQDRQAHWRLTLGGRYPVGHDGNWVVVVHRAIPRGFLLPSAISGTS